jgi:hypothetical protein
MARVNSIIQFIIHIIYLFVQLYFPDILRQDAGSRLVRCVRTMARIVSYTRVKCAIIIRNPDPVVVNPIRARRLNY